MYLGTFYKNTFIFIFFLIQTRAKISKNFELQATFAARLNSQTNREGRPWRLPNTTFPLKYHLHITTWIHQEVRNFTGNATIEVLVKESTSELVLHAKDLKIINITVEDLTIQQNIKGIKSKIIDDLLIIEVGQKKPPVFLQSHRLRLEILYMGEINCLMYGFSTMSYRDDRNKIIYGAYTHLEPQGARMVLPCYDEPAFKANFTVVVTHGSNYTAISNMPAVSSIANPVTKMTTTSFMETPAMCTYLLAFVISNYKSIEQKDNGILQRAFLPPNSKVNGSSILPNVIEALQKFSDLIGVPYTLPKLDHVSIKEFAMAAMENWGIITYRDSYFVEAKTQDHEIVHQWFGNLVSPAWWDSLWLNEGFATYFSAVLESMINSDYAPITDFILQTCLKETLYTNLISVAGYVEKPEDIWELFKLSSYSKAPCIVQMFENAFGAKAFRKGLSGFIKARAYSSANEEHLYDQLQTAMLESTPEHWNHSVHEMMRPWLHQSSLPIVTITRDYINNSNIIRIEQKSSTGDSSELWWIPLNFATASSSNFKNAQAVYYMPAIPAVTLNLTELNITLRSDDWLLANINNTGLYRVFYDEKNLLRLANTLQNNHGTINSFNRVLLIHSIPSIWKEQFYVRITLEMLKYLAHEEDLFVWGAIWQPIQTLQDILRPSKLHKLFNEFMEHNVKKLYLKYLKGPEEKLSPSSVKELHSFACLVELPECLNRSKARYLAKKVNIFKSEHPNLSPEDLCYAVKTFNDREFSEALEKLKKVSKQSFIRFWWPFMCTEDKTQVELLLRTSIAYLAVDTADRQRLLMQWADLLKTSSPMKWNSAYAFLSEQITKLHAFPNATYDLCKKVELVSRDIRIQFKVKYVNLLELCSEQFLKNGIVDGGTDIQLKTLHLGANYAFENDPKWHKALRETFKWLKKNRSFEN